MRFIFILLLIPFLGVTGNNDGGETNFLPLPKIIDTLPETEMYMDAGGMCSASSEISYIGNINKPSVNVNEEDTINRYSDGFSKNTHGGTSDPQIVVDTTQILSMPVSYQRRVIAEGDEEDEWDIMYYKSYPVFIVNRKDSLRLIGVQDGRVAAIQEAKDKNGDWKPIEYWQFSWCGNSYYDVKLYKNEFLLLKIPAYKGEFTTELRLKVRMDKKTLYSDTFIGSVNLSQFEKPAENVSHLSFLEDKR